MNINKSVVNTYYRWLCELVDSENRYNLLIKELHKKEFRWTVPNDDNRAFEGRNIRETFCEMEDISYCDDLYKREVSMLELILALAFRCERITVDSPHNAVVSEWFWRLLSNVGLDKFTNEEFYDLGGGFVVNQILDKIIDRTYDRFGKGGLFPLKSVTKNQRKVELWYQMNSYLLEKYYI